MEPATASTERPWDALPSPAIVNIFCRSSIRDRTRTLPLVCVSWSQASRHPLCWASMVAADTHLSSSSSDVDYAFVKAYHPYRESLVDFFDGQSYYNGVARLRALIQRAAGGAAVTSLYIFPFLANHYLPNDDALLRLIRKRCLNLKHISFHGSQKASQESLLKFIRCCKNLELVDFSDSPYFTPPILEEMKNCCPNLRGIRRKGNIKPTVSSNLLTGFPGLKLLNLSETNIVDKDLMTIVTGYPKLEYLDIKGCEKLVCYMYIIKASSYLKNIAYWVQELLPAIRFLLPKNL